MKQDIEINNDADAGHDSIAELRAQKIIYERLINDYQNHIKEVKAKLSLVELKINFVEKEGSLKFFEEAKEVKDTKDKECEFEAAVYRWGWTKD